MSKIKEEKKIKSKCLYCGNNPVKHLPAFISQSLSVYMTPVVMAFSLLDNRFSRTLLKLLFTPYIHFFKLLGLLRFNTDIEKANTKRSYVIWEEAKKRGIPMEQFVIFGKPVEQYRAKINGKWHYFESIPLPPSKIARSYMWMDNKLILKKKFSKAGIPVAFGGRADSFQLARKIFEKAHKPVIVKPEVGSRGRHTVTHIHTMGDLKKGFNIAQELCYFVVVEEHLFGSVYRGTYVGGEIVGILRGDPPRITGDGIHSISALIKQKNSSRPKDVKEFEITEVTEDFLKRQSFTLDNILPKGKTIDLSEKIGLSYGGFAVEEFPKTHPKILAYLKQAGDFLKAPVIGFDFIIEDVTKDPDTVRWGIIEANSLPFINLHHYPAEGEPRNVAAKIWDLWKK